MIALISLLGQAGLLLSTGVAAITDARTGYIYDWITYPSIALGLILSLATFFFSGTATNLVIGGILFVALYAMYHFGKIGGGDVKLFLGIALLNPFNDPRFLFSLILFASGSAITFYSIYYTIKYARVGINFTNEKEGIIKALLLGSATLLLFVIGGLDKLILTDLALILSIPFISGLLFMGLEKGIREHFFYVRISTRAIVEDEIIVSERLTKKAALILKGKYLVGPSEARVLTRKGITSLWIMRNLPKFGPFICIGTILALLNPFLFSFFFI